MRCDQLLTEGEPEAVDSKPVFDGLLAAEETEETTPLRSPDKYIQEEEDVLEDSPGAVLTSSTDRLKEDLSDVVRNGELLSSNLPVVSTNGENKGGGGSAGDEKNSRQSSAKPKIVPQSRHPDGGYGWVIVFASFLQQVSQHELTLR